MRAFSIPLFILLLFCPQKGRAELKDMEPAPEKKSSRRVKIKDVSDLQALTPYESVAVIQKRYLPKTFRGELNFSLLTIISRGAFYYGGLSAKAGFFLRENHGFGLEIFSPFFSPKRPFAKELLSYQTIILYTEIPKVYGGAYYKWSPVFGKFSLLNKKIIYFDMYFTLGGGWGYFKETYIEDKKRISSFNPEWTLARPHLIVGNWGLGQVFALSQDWAVQWELKFLYYIKPLINQKDGTTKTVNNFGSPDFGFSIGVNYYFPGAGYR